MKRLVLIPGAAVLVALLAVAAPALSLRPYRPEPVDFELAAPAAALSASVGRKVVSHPIATPKRFNLVGFHWRGAAEPAIAIRTRLRGRRWSRWTPVGSHGDHAPDPAADERSSGGGSDPVWVGEADELQYRMDRRPAGLRMHFVNTTGTATAAERARTGLLRAVNAAVIAVLGPPAARAQGAQPPIMSRSEWGADADCPPRAAPEYGQVKAMFVHHTVSTNDYAPEEGPAIVLAICRFHRNSRGWNDIGYNFLVDKYGRLYEGRAGGIGAAVVGAHAQGFNSETTSVSNIGTHTDVPQSEVALDAMAALIRWKLPLHGQPTAGTVDLTSGGGRANRYPAGAVVPFERISGHRDGGKTSCPGDALYAQLPALRARVGDSGLRPARTKLDALVQPGLVVFPGPTRVAGRLRLLRGDPVPDVSVSIQRLNGRAWQTIAVAETRGDGTFEALVTPSVSGLLRASYPGGASTRASVSKGSTVKVRPALEIGRSVKRARTGQTPIIDGTIRPTRSRVLLVVKRRDGRREATVARYKVRVRNGRFRKGHRVKTPGLYRFYAAFPGDRLNLAAASPAVYIRAVPSEGGAAARAR